MKKIKNLYLTHDFSWRNSPNSPHICVVEGVLFHYNPPHSHHISREEATRLIIEVEHQLYSPIDWNLIDEYNEARQGLNPLKRVKFISIKRRNTKNKRTGSQVSIPSNGSSLFQCLKNSWIIPKNSKKVSIPSNGSSLFQWWSMASFTIRCYTSNVSIPSNGSSLFQLITPNELVYKIYEESQSPQTGQVYFNLSHCLRFAKRWLYICLNPLKRVKFISIRFRYSYRILIAPGCLNPLKRVKFISIHSQLLLTFKRVGAVSIPSNGSSLFQYSGLENLWRYLGQ